MSNSAEIEKALPVFNVCMVLYIKKYAKDTVSPAETVVFVRYIRYFLWKLQFPIGKPGMQRNTKFLVYICLKYIVS